MRFKTIFLTKEGEAIEQEPENYEILDIGVGYNPKQETMYVIAVIKVKN